MRNKGRKEEKGKKARNVDEEKESGREINKEPTDGKYKNKIANRTTKFDS